MKYTRSSRSVQRLAAITVLLVGVLLATLLPLPVLEQYRAPRLIAMLAVYGALLGSVAIFWQRVVRNILSARFVQVATTVLVPTALVLAVLILSTDLKLPLWFVSVIPVAIVGAWSLYSSASDTLPAAGLLALILTVGSFLLLELCLRHIPAHYLISEVVKTPALTPPDRGNIVFQKHGFRGKRPCQACADDRIRIVTMGGSSTYGIPLANSADTYTAQLQRLLNERHPGQNYEVLNGGIAGYGITQIVDSLKKEVLKYRPDIVTICAWFNDSALVPNWYGARDKSDLESYRLITVLKWIEGNPFYALIHNTRLYALFRYYLLTLKHSVWSPSRKNSQRKRMRRMSPAEFRWGLEQVVALSEEHDFLPVFILEPLNHTAALEESLNRFRYYRVQREVARTFDVPLVDTLTALAARKDQWLFYDFIHPNAAGHRIIAEVTYRSLFVDRSQERVQRFWKSRGISSTPRNVRREFDHQFATENVRGKLLRARARLPSATTDVVNAQLLIEVNGMPFRQLDGLSRSWQTFDLKLNEIDPTKPITDFSFRAQLPNLPALQQSIGATGVVSPVQLAVTSGGKDYGWTTEISVQGQRYDFDKRGYNVAFVGAHSGQVKARRHFDLFDKQTTGAALARYLLSSESFTEKEEPAIVIISVKTDGRHRASSKELAPALQYIGATGELPAPFHSFLVIGVTGSTPGTAVEKTGPALLKAQVGDRSLVGMDLLELEVSVQ